MASDTPKREDVLCEAPIFILCLSNFFRQSQRKNDQYRFLTSCPWSTSKTVGNITLFLLIIIVNIKTAKFRQASAHHFGFFQFPYFISRFYLLWSNRIDQFVFLFFESLFMKIFFVKKKQQNIFFVMIFMKYMEICISNLAIVFFFVRFILVFFFFFENFSQNEIVFHFYQFIW